MDNIQLDLVNENKSLRYKIEECIHVNAELEKDVPIYVAKKYDQVDRALGKYINTYPEKNSLKILFLRESEGVY